MYEKRNDIVKSSLVSENAFPEREHNEGRNPKVLRRNGKKVERICTKFRCGHQIMEVVGNEAVVESGSVSGDTESCKKKHPEPTPR